MKTIKVKREVWERMRAWMYHNEKELYEELLKNKERTRLIKEKYRLLWEKMKK